MMGVTSQKLRDYILILFPTCMRSIVIFAIPFYFILDFLDFDSNYTYSYIYFIFFSSSINFYIVSSKCDGEKFEGIYSLINLIFVTVSLVLYVVDYSFFKTWSVFIFLCLFFNQYQLVRSLYYLKNDSVRRLLLIELFYLLLMVMFFQYQKNYAVYFILLFMLLDMVIVKLSYPVVYFKEKLKRVFLFGATNSLTATIPYITNAKALVIGGDGAPYLLQLITLNGIALLFMRLISLPLTKAETNTIIIYEYNKLFIKITPFFLLIMLNSICVSIFQSLIESFSLDDFYIYFSMCLVMSISLFQMPFSLLTAKVEKESVNFKVNLIYFVFFMYSLFFIRFENKIELLVFIFLSISVKVFIMILLAKNIKLGIVNDK